MKKNLLMMVMCFVALTISAKNEKTTTTFKVLLHCESCVNKVETNIAYEKGVKDIVCSIEDQTVSVTYLPNKTNVETLKEGFAKIGFEGVTVVEKKCCDHDKEHHEHDADEHEHKAKPCCSSKKEKSGASCE